MSRSRPFLITITVAALAACSPDPGTVDGGDDGGGDSGDPCSELGRLDQDGDGVPDIEEGDDSLDTDDDGTPDLLDDDSDDDGRSDAQESGIEGCEGPPIDTDGDGEPDLRDTDCDGNGIDDDEDSDDDFDEDGKDDWQDVDDDGDEISDAIELGPDPFNPADSDTDGVPDFHDTDSDGDTIQDRFEGSDDPDEDGLQSFRDADSDGDGWLDDEEYGANFGEPPVDSDSDGAADFKDTDSDDDRLLDSEEREAGTDPTIADTDGDTYTDYTEVQQGSDPLDGTDIPMPDPCDPGECGVQEYCGEDEPDGSTGHGDGLDNDCDGNIDDICPCTPGETRPCFVGRPSERGTGVCSDGILSCDEFGGWSECTGGVFPQTEVCDGSDNDCDGLFDEELEDCESPLTCAGTVAGAPLTTIELDGTEIYDGEFDSWTWEVFCPPTVDSCPVPVDAAAQVTTIYVIQSGAYRVRATIVIDGETYTCQYTIEVQGDGLRVELLWDTQGSAHGDTDVDLHLHRPGTETAWFDSNDDCYFSNCVASDVAPARPDWGYENTPDSSVCDEAPHGHGDTWASLGYCANPRLDVDIIYCNSAQTDSTADDFCSPENINVDNPGLADTFRIMVNYWSEHSYSGITHPTINIYCGGALRATYGGEAVELAYGGASTDADNWLVGDVMFYIDECGAIDCRIAPILNDEEGPWVQRGNDFGPPWSF